MKKLRFFLLMILVGALICPAVSSSQTAYIMDPSVPYLYVTGTNMITGWLCDTPGCDSYDDGYFDLSLGDFAFQFYGIPVSSLRIGTNGYMTFGTEGMAYWNDPIPYANLPNALIAPFQTDLYLTELTGERGVWWGMTGTAPNRELIIEWRQVPTYEFKTDSYSFEAILYEFTNRIKFQYLNVDSETPANRGAWSTVGVENFDGTAGNEYSYNTPTLSNGLAIEFVPVPIGLQSSLTVEKSGPGAGTVTSVPPGIDCGTDCSELYDTGVVVTLTATPDAGFVFAGWSGDPDCSDGSVTMNGNKTCIATFDTPTPTSTLTVTKPGTGTGIVTSTPLGIDCGADCSELYDTGIEVSLTATPNAGSFYRGWTGCTSSKYKQCTIAMNMDQTVMANFEAINFGGFNDVSIGYWADDYIYAIYQVGVTLGCGGGNYCPPLNVTREQMASFIVRAVDGTDATTCLGTMFGDVPQGAPHCANIERLRELNVTLGCGGGNYCPQGNVTRAEMASFLVRAVDGTDALTCLGTLFGDVPSGAPHCANIERLNALNITQGCEQGKYCPSNNVLRDQMAAFLARAFLQMQ
jgi:hypothetical protein